MLSLTLMLNETPLAESGEPSPFRTTCWTDVLCAARKDSKGEEAFSRLYQDYWTPVYRYVQRRGYAHAQAEEITQEFFVALLTKDRLTNLQREGGRFRSFLLTAMKNFLANLWQKQTAAKRGGGATVLSLDASEFGEAGQLAREEEAAEAIYDREWAMLVLERVTGTLKEEYIRAHKETLFATLREKIQGDRSGDSYAVLASKLEMSEGAVKVAMHRMRDRFAEILREEISRTVQSEAEVQEEIRYLLRVVSQ